MRKRGQNEGSIFKEGPGKWRASISLGWKNGKRVRKTFTASTRGEVKDKLTKALREHQLGINIAPERQTVGQFLDAWLEDVVKPSVRPKTHRTYSDLVKIHIKPAIGNHLLQKLTAKHVQAFLNEKVGSAFCPYCKLGMPFDCLEAHVAADHADVEKRKRIRETGLSARTVRHIHATLRDALNVAVRWDLAPRNVAMLVEPPRAKKPEIRTFTKEQARKYLDAAHGDRLEALFTATVAVGLRQGEILGLGWKHIDFEAGRLLVCRALQRVDGKLVFVETKPDRVRTIALPAVAVSALLKHRARQEEERALAGEKWTEAGLVFPTSIGTPMDARNVIRHHHAVLKRAGLPRIRFHDLRHSAATLLLAQGVSPKYISEMLGHSQVAFTMQVYAHVIAEVQQEVAAKMDEILTPRAPLATSVATSTKPKIIN